MTEIRPELQQLRVGDSVVLHGRSGFGPPVVLLEAESALVLVHYLMDPIGFVMSKKMLRTVKRLAETSQR